MNPRDGTKKKQMRRFRMTKKRKEKIGNRDEIEMWTRLIFRGMKTNYLISTCGRLKRIKKTKNSRRYVTRYINRDNYLQVEIRINGKCYLPSVHRLVALTFIPIPSRYLDLGYSENDLVVNHINGLTFDPYVGNLEWCTPSENAIHAYENNLRTPKYGEKHPNSVLKKKVVKRICKLLEKGVKNVKVAEITGVPVTLVNQIKSGSIWRHVSKDYDIKIKRRDKYNYITEDVVHDICKHFEDGYSTIEVSDMFNLSRHQINSIYTRKRWKKISKNYNF